MDNTNDPRLAVLIDADNIPHRLINGILEEIAKYGVPTFKRIYADWTKPHVSGWKSVLLDHAITPVQQYSYTTGKNSSDSALIIDAMDILETIVAAKRKEVEKFKPMSSIERFERDGFFWQISNRSLVQSLLLPGSTGIIAEFKRKSPSKGWFKSKELEVEPVVSAYNKSAAGISVLTDDEFFGGDLDDLIQTKVITDIPVLRKDFIIDKWQIAEAKAFGADVILLIAACLSPTEVK